MLKLHRILNFGFLILGLGLIGAVQQAQSSTILTDDPFPLVDPLGLSPTWDWKTFTTEHFRISFPNELKEVAVRSAKYLEEAHLILSPLLRWEPSTKTQILVIDNQDMANGLTVPFGRVGIVLWAIPPESWDSTSYYDDWLRLLIIHEYTHYLNMSATHGYAALGKIIFGDAFVPNSLWAPWMYEGLAVFMETLWTQGGRGRSSYYDMILRAAINDHVFNETDFVTLDKVNGYNPYFPGGDTRYLFGYFLMNKVAQYSLNGYTADGKTATQGKEDLLGIVSDRSSYRIPFLINENLLNIIGKDWHRVWDEWATETNSRIQADIQKLKTQPLTQYTSVIPNQRETSNEVLGCAVSPDGKWLTYTLASSDKRSGLYLKNLKTGETKRLQDKLGGVGLSFTPDSRTIIFSELQRRDIYYVYSDLRAYNLEMDTTYDLSKSLRARDPHVSPDGKKVVFTLTQNATTGLAIAYLEKTDKKYSIKNIIRIYTPSQFDHVGHPKFSNDGKMIYFSLHSNGKVQEDLMALNVETHQLTTLVSDGHFNLFPTLDAEGNLYFISNKTNVNNLYLYRGNKSEPLLLTNLVTGLNAPCFNSATQDSSRLYAPVFSANGWNLSSIDLDDPNGPHHLRTTDLTISRPPIPTPIKQNSNVTASSDHSNNPTHSPIEDYSLFPSILPRLWSPLLGIDQNGVAIGGEVLGFDSTNRHRYVLASTYSTQYQVWDGYLRYSNRSLGPIMGFSTSYLTSPLNSKSSSLSYYRSLELNISASYPILWTYSSFTPSTSVSVNRDFSYQKMDGSTDSNNSQLTFISPTVTAIDQVLTYSNEEYSKLGISAESGRFTQIGARVYFTPQQPLWKGLFIDRENFRITQHTILSPSIKASWASHFNTLYPSSNAVLEGRSPQNMFVFGGLSGDGFKQLSIRGYPNFAYLSKFAAVGALDLKFPIARIFRGLGVQPAFFDNLYGFTFAETSYFQSSTGSHYLPSLGGGVRLTSEFFSVLNTTFSVEYHQGLRSNLGGTEDLFFQVFVSATNF